jgi:hypothetical protein
VVAARTAVTAPGYEYAAGPGSVGAPDPITGTEAVCELPGDEGGDEGGDDAGVFVGRWAASAAR